MTLKIIQTLSHPSVRYHDTIAPDHIIHRYMHNFNIGVGIGQNNNEIIMETKPRRNIVMVVNGKSNKKNNTVCIHRLLHPTKLSPSAFVIIFFSLPINMSHRFLLIRGDNDYRVLAMGLNWTTSLTKSTTLIKMKMETTSLEYFNEWMEMLDTESSRLVHTSRIVEKCGKWLLKCLDYVWKMTSNKLGSSGEESRPMVWPSEKIKGKSSCYFIVNSNYTMSSINRR